MDPDFKQITRDYVEEIIDKYIAFREEEDEKWEYEDAKMRIEQLVFVLGSYCIMIIKNDEIIGFALGFFKQFDTVKIYYLEEILIGKKFRNHGYGTMLLKKLEQDLKSSGCNKITLLTTHSDEHRRFYERLGFVDNDFLRPLKKDI